MCWEFHYISQQIKTLFLYYSELIIVGIEPWIEHFDDLRIHRFDQYQYCPSVSSKIRIRTSILQRHAGQLNFQFNMTKVRGNTLVRLMNTLVKSSIQWRTRWLDLVSWPTVFTLGLRPYEINHSSMNAKAKKNNNNILTFSTKRFQTPTESQYAKARRKRKDSEGTHVRQVSTFDWLTTVTKI